MKSVSHRAAGADGRAASSERLGRGGGLLLAPVVGLVSRVRRARMFHPDGIVYAARVVAAEADPHLRAVGDRLAGPAIVRVSSAWWRGGKEWLDVLGLALRIGPAGSAPGAEAHPGDQDLLFATIRFPWTTPLAPLATDVTSFLWNHFHAVSPFDIPGIGRVKLRLRSPRLANPGGIPRAEHLARAVADGEAIYQLEVRRLAVAIPRRRWEGVASVALVAPIEVDQAALRFSPFRAGREVQPVGLVHNLRRATYDASQAARPVSE